MFLFIIGWVVNFIFIEFNFSFVICLIMIFVVNFGGNLVIGFVVNLSINFFVGVFLLYL